MASNRMILFPQRVHPCFLRPNRFAPIGLNIEARACLTQNSRATPRSSYCGDFASLVPKGFVWKLWHVAHECSTPPAGLWQFAQEFFGGTMMSDVSELC